MKIRTRYANVHPRNIVSAYEFDNQLPIIVQLPPVLTESTENLGYDNNAYIPEVDTRRSSTILPAISIDSENSTWSRRYGHPNGYDLPDNESEDYNRYVNTWLSHT